MLTIALATLATFFCFLTSGALVVSVAAKITGWPQFVDRIGGARRGAGLLLCELALVSASLVMHDSTPVLAALGAFFLIGAGHRAIVVLSPDQDTCVCAQAGHKTSWADVSSNIVLVAVAGVLAWSGVNVPPFARWTLGLLLATFLAWWAVNQIRRRQTAREVVASLV